MADVWEKDLGQKSSLTTSDFIRVVGSDNVSYKQGVSNVAETFAQALPRYSAVTSLKDWATATNGRGITITNSTTTDTPSQTSNKYGVAWTNSYSDGTNPWANLFWSPTGSTDIYMCQKTNTSAWSDWVKMPTRAEVDALNSKSSGTLTSAHLYDDLVYVKCGNMCTVNIPALKDLTGNAETTIGTLPSGYRPYSAVQVIVGLPGISGFSRAIRVTINTGGVITAYLYGSSIADAVNVRGCVTFPV